MTRPRIDPTVSLGNILLIASVIGTGLVMWGERGQQAANTATAVTSFDTRLTREMSGVQQALDELRRTVNPIGTLNQRTSELERRATEADARDNAQDMRLSAFAEAIATIRARQDAERLPPRQVRP